MFRRRPETNSLLATLIIVTSSAHFVGCRDRSSSETTNERTVTQVSSSAPTAAPSAVARPVVNRVDPPAGAGSESPNLFSSPRGALLTWIESDKGKPSIRLSRFMQGQWSPPTTVVTSEELLVNWADVPAVAEAGEQIFVAFPEMRKQREGYRAELAISTDGGKTFTRRGALHTDSSDTEHGFIAFAPEGKTSVRAFWLDQRALAQNANKPDSPTAAMRLYTALVEESVTNESMLDERTCDCCSLAVGRTDKGAVVAYRDRDQNEIRDIAVVRSDGNSFSAPLPLHDDGYRIAGCPVNGPSLATNGARVAIAWYTYAKDQGRIKIAFSDNAGTNFSPPTIVAESNGAFTPIGRVSVAWGDQDDAVIAYVETDRENARLVVRRVHPSGQTFAPFVIAQTRPDRKSGFPKMVRLDNDLLVSWTEVDSSTHVRAARVPLAAVTRDAAIATATSPQANQSVRVGDTWPKFDVQTLEGKPISSTQLAGKPVLVNLWASYCEPCRQELPALSKIHAQYEKRGLQVVGIAMDERIEGEAMKKLAGKRGIQYPIWLDRQDRSGQALGVRELPATFLIDRAGVIVWVRRGAVHDDDVELKRAIEKLL